MTASSQHSLEDGFAVLSSKWKRVMLQEHPDKNPAEAEKAKMRNAAKNCLENILPMLEKVKDPAEGMVIFPPISSQFAELGGLTHCCGLFSAFDIIRKFMRDEYGETTLQ